MRFKIVLSEHGKDVYKGGNIPVMKRMLISFDARDLSYAQGFFEKRLRETMGSASQYLFKVERVK